MRHDSSLATYVAVVLSADADTGECAVAIPAAFGSATFTVSEGLTPDPDGGYYVPDIGSKQPVFIDGDHLRWANVSTAGLGAYAEKLLAAHHHPDSTDHDDRYYTEDEIDDLLAPLAVDGHSHDDRYYTEAEADTRFQPLDADLTALAGANNSSILAATTSSFTTSLKSKLDGIESGATGDQTAAEILAALKTVDGAGSGLDADLLYGQQASYYLAWANLTGKPALYTESEVDAFISTIYSTLRSEDDGHQAAAEATAANALAAHITDLNNGYTFGGDVYASSDLRGLTTLRIGAGAFTGGAGYTLLDANQLRSYTSEGTEGTLYLQHSGGTLNFKNGSMTFASDGAISVTKPTSFTGGHTHDINGNLTLTGRVTQSSAPSSDNHLVRLTDLNAEIADLLAGSNTFTGNSIFTGSITRIHRDSPYLEFWDANSTSVDKRRWEIGVGNDDLRIRNLSDAGATLGTQVIISVDDINLKAPVTLDDTLLVDGNTTITGDLVVQGSTLQADVQNYIVQDPVMELGGTTTANDGKDRGILLQRGNGSTLDKMFMGWDTSNARFVLRDGVILTNEVVTTAGWADLAIGSLEVNGDLGMTDGSIADINQVDFGSSVGIKSYWFGSDYYTSIEAGILRHEVPVGTRHRFTVAGNSRLDITDSGTTTAGTHVATGGLTALGSAGVVTPALTINSQPGTQTARPVGSNDLTRLTDLWDVFVANSTSGSNDWNDSIGHFGIGVGDELLQGVNPNGPNASGGFYYTFNLAYASPGSASNRTQLAIPYNGTGKDATIWWRNQYSSTWSNWIRMVNGVEFDALVDDGSFTGTTSFLTDSTRGWVFKPWSGSASYASLATDDMSGDQEYVLLSDGNHTFVSSGVGHSVFLRPGGNSGGGQVELTTNSATFDKIINANGGVTLGGTSALTLPYLTNQQHHNADTMDSFGGFAVRYGNSATTNKAPGSYDHAYLTMSYSTAWAAQMAADWYDNRWSVRVQENGTWSSWEELAQKSYVDTQDLTILDSAVDTATSYADTRIILAQLQGSNMVPNGNFENGLDDGWRSGYSPGDFTVTDEVVPPIGSYAGKVIGDGTSNYALSASLVIDPDRSYSLSAWLYHDLAGATDGTVVLRIYWQDEDGVGISGSSWTDVGAALGSYEVGNYVPSANYSTWSHIAGTVTPPAAARRALVGVLNWSSSTGNLYFTDVRLTPQLRNVEIGDNEISTLKLQTNALKSLNYNGPTTPDTKSFATTGTFFDLAGGDFWSEQFYISGNEAGFGGKLVSPSGTIGAWEIGATYLRDGANQNIVLTPSVGGLSRISLGSNVYLDGKNGDDVNTRIRVNASGGLGLGPGLYADGLGRFSVGNPDTPTTGKGIKWDGTTFSVVGDSIMHGDSIINGSLTADRLAIGLRASGQNLVVNPYGANGTDGWVTYTGEAVAATTDSGAPSPGEACIRVGETSGSNGALGAAVPLTIGQKYRLSMWVRTDSTKTSGLYLGVWLTDNPGSSSGHNHVSYNEGDFVSLYLLATNASYAPYSDWTFLSAEFTAPRAWGSPVCLTYNGPDGYTYLTDVRIEPMVASTLIEGGAVTADKLTINDYADIAGAKIGNWDINSTQIVSSGGTYPVTLWSGGWITIGAGNYYNNDTPFYAGEDGRFSLKQKLRFDGTDLAINGSGTFSGTVTATAGAIGGWNVTADRIQSPAGSYPIVIRSDGNFYAGTGTYGNANTPFFMNTNGYFSLGNKLTFNGSSLSINGSGTFTGSLTGASGSFGGWTLNSSGINHASGQIGLASSGAVTLSGAISASSLTINSGVGSSLTSSGNGTFFTSSLGNMGMGSGYIDGWTAKVLNGPHMHGFPGVVPKVSAGGSEVMRAVGVSHGTAKERPYIGFWTVSGNDSIPGLYYENRCGFVGYADDSDFYIGTDGRALVLDASSVRMENQTFWVHKNLGLNNKSWNHSQAILSSMGTSGDDNTNSIIQMSFWDQRGAFAPIIGTYRPRGEIIRVVNNPNTAHTWVEAAGFTVMSTARVKEDLEWVEDKVVIKAAKEFLLTRFRNKVPPQSMRLSERFVRIDAGWQAKGRAPLQPRMQDYESHDHDCGIDNCDGTRENPCCITVNNSYRYGTLAEWQGEVTPEMTNIDEHGRFDSVDVDQVASLALGGVGALARQVERLEARIKELEASR